MLLSATSPLLQAWYVRTHHGALPYRLFALSNFGSLLALLSYPFVIEPRLTLSRQAAIWSMRATPPSRWRARPPDGRAANSGPAPASTPKSEADAPPPSLATKIFWVALAACASTLLLATTSHLTQNVAPIPLLWVVPLSMYLLSFILCFESGRLVPALDLHAAAGRLAVAVHARQWPV